MTGVLRDAVAELLACFPVYRSYLPLGVEHLVAAFASARARPARPAAAYSTRWSRSCPTRRSRPRCGSSRPRGMVMAKGVEDCAFYRYSRLTSLNEVGGDPSVFSLTRRRVPRGDGASGSGTGRTR